MRYNAAIALVALCGATGLVPAAAQTAAPAAQVDIAKVTCDDLRSATPLDRSAVVMFYWGYAAAKAGATTFKTGLIKRATTALMSECAAHDGETVLDAMGRINVKAF